MSTNPKKLSFAEEMELLKKQRAQEAEQAKALLVHRRLERYQAQKLQSAPLVSSACSIEESLPNALENGNTSESRSRLDFALAAVMPTGAVLLPSPSNVALQVSTPVLQEDERQLKIRAMEAAFAKHVGEHQPKNAKKEKVKDPMMFCTSCRLTTPGEYIKPGNTGIGMALGLIGLVPGIAYFLYQRRSTKQRCTHCQATTLVGMNSVQARTLCGDQHAVLMAAGWPEMRRAERDHTRQRRIAMAKIMVVGVVLLGASLYVLRAPSSSLKGVLDHGARQKLQTIDMIEKQNSGAGIE